MIERFYSNEASLGIKMIILDAIDLAVNEMSAIKKEKEKMKESKVVYSEKTIIKAPRKLALMNKKEGQSTQFLKYANHFFYGLLWRISDRNVNLKLFSEMGEQLLIKLISTLARILSAARTLIFTNRQFISDNANDQRLIHSSHNAFNCY